MAINLVRMLHQDITYWQPMGSDIQGAPTFSAPIHLKGRWEDISELFWNKKGQEVVSRSRIFLLDAVDLEGYLYKGYSTETEPRTLDGAHEIQMTKTTPDLHAVQNLIVAML